METVQTTPPNMETTKNKSSLGIVVLIVIALVIIGIIFGMHDTKKAELQEDQRMQNTTTTNGSLYNDVNTMDQNIDSVQFEGSADTLN